MRIIDYYNDNSILKGPCWKVFKASIIKENKIVFPVELDYGEDVCFVYDYLDKIKTVMAIQDPLYVYTIKSKSLSQGFRKDKLKTNLLLNQRLFDLKSKYQTCDHNLLQINNLHNLIDYLNDASCLTRKEFSHICKESRNNSTVIESLKAKKTGEPIKRRIAYFLFKSKMIFFVYLMFRYNRTRKG